MWLTKPGFLITTLPGKILFNQNSRNEEDVSETLSIRITDETYLVRPICTVSFFRLLLTDLTKILVGKFNPLTPSKDHAIYPRSRLCTCCRLVDTGSRGLQPGDNPGWDLASQGDLPSIKPVQGGLEGREAIWEGGTLTEAWRTEGKVLETTVSP